MGPTGNSPSPEPPQKEVQKERTVDPKQVQERSRQKTLWILTRASITPTCDILSEKFHGSPEFLAGEALVDHVVEFSTALLQAKFWANRSTDMSTRKNSGLLATRDEDRELIPEFYYLPEMFVNFNNYNLGVMDDGTVVSDVELPPWAKTSEEFVHINRLATSAQWCCAGAACNTNSACFWHWAMAPAAAVYLQIRGSAVDFVLPLDAFMQLCTGLLDK
ncbi:hypothetical protein P7K49_006942 [Saguinus oedipus]|uniref:BEACH domain-containing protein n=1 Tax=Saguinus oedipus TaxID=9490 RepID=A0ABQ9W4N2_SAGOE|nr:hypothetical protein P7K49_006942 [Saguinus oedipus]